MNDFKQRVNNRPRQVCDVRDAVQYEVRGEPQKETNDRSDLGASADRQGANPIPDREREEEGKAKTWHG